VPTGSLEADLLPQFGTGLFADVVALLPATLVAVSALPILMNVDRWPAHGWPIGTPIRSGAAPRRSTHTALPLGAD
jgi:hypothetical protein